jgi:hypothetical protein
MVVERPARRMTLRQQLTHSEKCCRDLIEHFQAVLLPRIADFRDLSRPVRRRSHYPTMVAVLNGLKHLQQAHEEVQSLVEHLQEQLQQIREHARRERINRL